MTYRNHIAIAVGLILVAACAAPQKRSLWQNPNIPQAEWGIDTAACNRYARQEVIRQLGAQLGPQRTDNLGGGTATYNQQMTQYRAQRIDDQSFSACMQRRGYRQGVGPTPPQT